MNIPRASSRRAGYTLMEMMLVLFIIALILGGGVYLMQNVGQDAEISKAHADITAWMTNLVRYKTRYMTTPTQSQGLECMVTMPSGDVPKGGWTQLAKPEALNDPWGHKYQYRNPGTHNPNSYDIYSLGPDGIEGTPDDIGNWQSHARAFFVMNAGLRNWKLPVRRFAGSGFTLLELVVVLFIMAVFLSMAALSFESVDEQEVLEKPAVALQRAAREAMRHASIYEQPEVIVFDKRGFGVRYKTEADASGQGGGTWEQHTELPEGMTIFVKHWGQTQWQPAAGEKWQVLSSGLCEPISVRIDRGHSFVEMQFNPLTGGVVDKRLVILP